MNGRMTADDVRTAVRSDYAKVARGEARAPEKAPAGSCCGGSTGCCAVPVSLASVASERLGYSREELESLPEGANLGLGCGNPQAIAELKPGEVVVDLGSGAGIDCFLAAKNVGPTGRVFGVDMTPEMVTSARAFARDHGYTNVEFRLGEIEALPLPDGAADVVISNCVINLSPEKGRVFAEMFRVLKPGGRVAISDVVAIAEIPASVRNSIDMLTGCIAGAATVETVERLLRETGFGRVSVEVKEESRAFVRDWAPGTGIERFVASASISAVKP